MNKKTALRKTTSSANLRARSTSHSTPAGPKPVRSKSTGTGVASDSKILTLTKQSQLLESNEAKNLKLKEYKCSKVLKTYGVFVDFEGEYREKAGKRKAQTETVAAWKNRVLGPKVKEVVFYIPTKIAPQKKFKSLKEDGGAHVIRVISQLTHLKELQFEETQEELVEQYSKIPKKTLQEIVDSFEDSLEPSVQEFLERFLSKTDRKADVRELLSELTEAFNKMVVMFREASDRLKRYERMRHEP